MSERDVFSVPLVGGLDTKSDQKSMQPPSLQVCENAIFTQRGSVKKRTGYAAVGTTDVAGNAIVGDPVAVGARGTEVVMMTTRRIYSRNENEETWQVKGPYSPVNITHEGIFTENTAQEYGDVTQAGDYKVFAAAGAVYVSDSDGNPVSGRMAIDGSSTYTARRAVSIGNKAFILGGSTVRMFDASTMNADINTSDHTTLTCGSDINDDAVCAYNTTYALHAYANGNTVYIAHIDANGAHQNTTTVRGITANHGLALSYNSSTDRVGLIFCDHVTTANSDVYMYEFNPSNFSVTGSTTYANMDWTGMPGISGHGNGWMCTYASVSGTVTSNLKTILSIRAQAFASETDSKTIGAPMVCAGYNYTDSDGIGYLMMQYTDGLLGLNHTYLLLSGEGFFCGQTMPGDAATPWTASGQLVYHGVGYSMEDLELVTPYRRRVGTGEGDDPLFEDEGLRLTTLDFTATPYAESVDDVLYITGGYLWAYDGINVYPAGMPYFPMYPTSQFADGAAASGTDPASGVQYNYRIYYEWRNNKGQIVRSNAIIASNTPSANDSQDITIPTISATNIGEADLASAGVPYPASDIECVVYRTEGNKSDFYYKVGSETNVPTQYVVVFNDDVQDADLITNQVDYKTQDEIGDDPVAGASMIRSVGDRMIVVGGTLQDNDVLVSKPHDDGAPLRFTLNFVVTDAPESGGPIKGIASLDGTPIIFKRRQIFALVGEGPDKTGGTGTYISKELTSDVGLEDPGAVVVVPQGVIFKSKKGFYLLDNTFNVTYIGAPVESYNGQTFTAAHVLPDSNLVVFLASSGSTVVYDYFYNQWGVWTNHTGKSACVTEDGTYVYMRGDGRVYIADSSLYQDAGTDYSLKIRTAPIRPPNTLQGHWLVHRFQVLGEYVTDHDLVVGLYYDRDTSADESYTWSMASGDYHHEHVPKRSKCQSIRFEFSDTVGSPVGAGYELTEISILYSQWSGLARIAATRQY